MTTTTNFVWDSVSDCVLSELDGTNAVQAVYTNEPQHYGGVLSQRRGTTTSTLHADALGTTRALTDSTQTTPDTYLYDAWGNLITSSGSTVNPFRWLGKYGYYHDASTGLVYVRARMYQPTVARWCSVDPLYVALHMEWFSYSHSNPLIAVDPTGLVCCRTEGDPKETCESVLANFLLGSFIKGVLTQFEIKKCKPPEFKCIADCTKLPGLDDKTQGVFYPLGKAPPYPYPGPQQHGNSILLCANNAKTFIDEKCPGEAGVLEPWMTSILWHELRHALDYCLYGHPGDDSCDELLCAEIRAYSWAGQCDDGSIYRRQYDTREVCLIAMATASATGRGRCSAFNDDPVGLRNRAAALIEKCQMKSGGPGNAQPPFPRL